jgi:hypothetical protein
MGRSRPAGFAGGWRGAERLMSELRKRVQEITAEYWAVRETQSEHVAVAQLILAFARLEVAASSSSRPPAVEPEETA